MLVRRVESGSSAVLGVREPIRPRTLDRVGLAGCLISIATWAFDAGQSYVGEVEEGIADFAEGDEEELALDTFRHVIIRYVRVVYRNAALEPVSFKF